MTAVVASPGASDVDCAEVSSDCAVGSADCDDVSVWGYYGSGDSS